MELSRRQWLAVCAGGCGSLPAAESEDVSRIFQAAPGVQVTQITNSPLGNQLSYYDIPCYSPSAERVLYNTVVEVPGGGKAKKVKPDKGAGNPDGAVWGVVSSRLDGSEARLLVRRIPATNSTVRVDLSQDGKLVTYTRQNDQPESGWDLYGFRVTGGPQVEEFRITRLQAPPATNKVKTSPPAWDGQAEKYLCAFAIDEKAYLVYHDGTRPGGGNGPLQARLTDLSDFPERRKKDTSFHRIRLNPVFPYLLYYRRNGVKDNWAIDLSSASPRSMRITDYQASIHATWSADGRILAGSMHGPWVEWTVADANGRPLPAFTPRETGPFGLGGRPGIFYGCYSHDNRRIAVATRFDQEPGGSLWLLNRDSGKAAYLCKARYFGPVTAGQPRMGFADADRALVFSSDNSAGQTASKPPQIFVVRPLPQV